MTGEPAAWNLPEPAIVTSLAPGGHRVRGDEVAVPGRALPGQPTVLRTALEALTFRPDGSRAAANIIIRNRVVLHGALGYAAEAGPMPGHPLGAIGWQVPGRQRPSIP